MAARKDRPEMFEAFKRVEAARRERAEQAGQQKPAVSPTAKPPQMPQVPLAPKASAQAPRITSQSPPKPAQAQAPAPMPPPVKPISSPAPDLAEVPPPSPQPAASSAPAMTSVGSSSRPTKATVGVLAPSRSDRPWTQPAKSQEDKDRVYIPLGQKSQVVISMSYGWAFGSAVVLGALMFVMLGIGWMTAGGSRVTRTAGIPSGSAVTPTTGNIVVPTTASVAPTTGNVVEPTSENPPGVVTPTGAYRVQVITVDNSNTGQKALIDARDFLSRQGFTEFELLTIRGKLSLLVGNYKDRNEADQAAERIKTLKRGFETAFVRHTSAP